MGFSESLYITVSAAAGASVLGLAFYFRSILLTSRCTDVACLCLKWKNQPISEAQLTNVMDHEQAMAPAAQPRGGSPRISKA